MCRALARGRTAQDDGAARSTPRRHFGDVPVPELAHYRVTRPAPHVVG
jgi:hypothetical protein